MALSQAQQKLLELPAAKREAYFYGKRKKSQVRWPQVNVTHAQGVGTSSDYNHMITICDVLTTCWALLKALGMDYFICTIPPEERRGKRISNENQGWKGD